MTTDKLGHRTHNRQLWNEVWTRGTNTGGQCSYRYTNGLLAESKIQSVYDRNTRRRSIKVCAGTATLAFSREPSVKAKQLQKRCNGHSGDWTYYFEGARCARRIRCTNRLLRWLHIYSLNYKVVKIIFFDIWNVRKIRKWRHKVCWVSQRKVLWHFLIFLAFQRSEKQS